MIQPTRPTVLIGQVAPLGAGGPPSGIDKRLTPGPWRITIIGIEGDAQGDLKHHGGPEKALHHYPFDHYAVWSAETSVHPLLFGPGAFGENLSTVGWTEHDVCIGDVVRFGSAFLQVSQGRQPCFKLNRRFQNAGMASAVQATGRTGWYWRVMEEGTAQPGEELVPIDRPQADWPLSRLLHVFYVDRGNREELEKVAKLPQLAESWRIIARRRLESGAVEDWSRRLAGTAT